ncbi:MAG: phosphate acyltransferase [bacterium]|nr:phosphate acyltransferase [bacterium]
MTDDKKMILPELTDFDGLLKLVQKRLIDNKPPRTALVLPHESAMVAPFKRAIDMNLIDPFVVGDEAIFRKDQAVHGIDPDTVHFIDIQQPDMAVVTAGQMASGGELDLLLKGRMAAEAFLRLLFDHQTKFTRKGQAITHVSVMKPERYPKLLALADAGITVSHEIKDLVATLNSAAGFLRLIGIEKPRVAVLAAVEVVYPQMSSTIKGATLSVMARRKQIKNVFVDGPLSFDVAIDAEAAQGKGITDSEVAGQADLLLATDLGTANATYKAMTMFGKVGMGAIAVGGAVPFSISAYCDSEETRFNSILLGLLASLK